MTNRYSITHADLAADWNAIQNMTFAGTTMAHNTEKERVYLKPHTPISMDFGRLGTIDFKTGNDPVWLSTAIKALMNTDKYAERIVKHKSKKAPMVITHGKTIPRREKTPLRPMTAEENAARINRNRAALGLAPLNTTA